MAAPTVSLDTPIPARIGNQGFGVLTGQVTVSSYDATHPAVTAVAGVFAGGKCKCFIGGPTTSGYMPGWDDATSSFKVYDTTTAGGVLTEVGSTTNCGTFDFIAMGKLGL